MYLGQRNTFLKDKERWPNNHGLNGPNPLKQLG